jgi:hypothetical protein
MVAKPRPDSYEYPIRFLNKRMMPVKRLAEYLRENNILFFLKYAEAMALQAKFGPELTIEDIPETVPTEHRLKLVELCNAVLAHYKNVRAKQAEEKAKVEEWRQRIPPKERERLLKLAGTERVSYFFEGDDHWQAALKTLSAIEAWILKTPEEREAWFTRVEGYINRKKAAWEETSRRYREESRRMFEEWERTGQFNWGRPLIFSSQIMTYGEACSTLGVPTNASNDEVKSAWRRLVKKHHPDAGGNPEMFMRVKEAYGVLAGS